MKQSTALDILKLGYNVLLTGPAGSGKTYLLNQYIAYLKKKKIDVAITASTGIAATHLNGQTIHSWSGMGIKEAITEKDLNYLKSRYFMLDRFETTKVLIIDEISMLHAHQLDIVNSICKKFKNSAEPFGGLQIVLCGDFFQLPPVIKNGKKAKFVFQSEDFREMGLKVCHLEEQHRQEDPDMISILNDIRDRTCTKKTMDLILSRKNVPVNSSIIPTKIFTHNINVDNMNNTELGKIPGEARKFKMTSFGNAFLVDSIKRGCLAPETLALKKGAVVMFVKNNFDCGYINGTLGKVVDFDDESGLPIVETFSGEKIIASPEKWSIEDGKTTIASITQIPLRLAWAITVHKSQGMTLDAVEMDLSGAFECGMGYVALSRVRRLDGIKLFGINDKALEVNSLVYGFDKLLKEVSEVHASETDKMDEGEKKRKQKEFVEKCAE